MAKQPRQRGSGRESRPVETSVKEEVSASLIEERGCPPLIDLREIARAASTLARNPGAFAEAYKAFVAQDSASFQDALRRAEIGDRCCLICFFFCTKHCSVVCRSLCPEPVKGPLTAEEMAGFAKALDRLMDDDTTVRRLLEVIGSGDVGAWEEWMKKLEMTRYCHQLCHFLCKKQCHEVCRLLCPPKPLITRVGSIPIARIDATGLGNGPSIPPYHVPPPNPPGGIGDHPFGGSVWLMGVFNMATATEYLVELSSTGPNGTYTPVIVSSVLGYNYVPWFPFVVPCTRFPSTGMDPGWFRISEICDSDGGPTTSGEKTLLYWPSNGRADGTYHLRLRVRDGSTTRVSAPQVVQLDNTGPFPLPRPTISLQLEKPDGTRVPLKCGKVRKGDGLIVITIQAYDPHMSSVAVTARGNSGLSVPIVDTSNTPLSKTYNGNLADQGYPVPTEFLWDPWNDPDIVPCCYVIYVEVWDRTIINDMFPSGHYNAGWEAVEIGF